MSKSLPPVTLKYKPKNISEKSPNLSPSLFSQRKQFLKERELLHLKNDEISSSDRVQFLQNNVDIANNQVNNLKRQVTELTQLLNVSVSPHKPSFTTSITTGSTSHSVSSDFTFSNKDKTKNQNYKGERIRTKGKVPARISSLSQFGPPRRVQVGQNNLDPDELEDTHQKEKDMHSSFPLREREKSAPLPSHPPLHPHNHQSLPKSSTQSLILSENDKEKENHPPQLSTFINSHTTHQSLAYPSCEKPSKNLTCKTLSVGGHKYLLLELIGTGGTCKVYKVIPLNTAHPETREAYKNEINLLKKLKSKPGIIQLYKAEEDSIENCIKMVFEYGEIDLHKHIKQLQKQFSSISENFLRNYWQQMLEAVHTIHSAKIIHSDLKPANFLVVKGSLKLIDFGIANMIIGEDTHVLKKSTVGTLNYISPEAFQQNEISIKSDIWSLGCILYSMTFGNPPFAHISNQLAKYAAIVYNTEPVPIPPHNNIHLVDVLKQCLQRDPIDRPTIMELLQHRFLHPTSHQLNINEAQVQKLLAQFGVKITNDQQSALISEFVRNL